MANVIAGISSLRTYYSHQFRSYLRRIQRPRLLMKRIRPMKENSSRVLDQEVLAKSKSPILALVRSSGIPRQ